MLNALTEILRMRGPLYINIVFWSGLNKTSERAVLEFKSNHRRKKIDLTNENTKLKITASMNLLSMPEREIIIQRNNGVIRKDLAERLGISIYTVERLEWKARIKLKRLNMIKPPVFYETGGNFIIRLLKYLFLLSSHTYLLFFHTVYL